MKLRTATWNIQRPNGSRKGIEEERIESLKSQIKGVDADIWISECEVRSL